MKVMLIGGTGVLSKDIAKQCVDKKLDLYMINRGQNLQYAPKDTNIIIGDIYNPVSLKKSLKGIDFDVVVDFLSYTPEQLSTTLNLFRGKCKQYIFISSATVYSKENPDEFITEETPLNNYGWDYSKNKINCEKILEKEHEIYGLQYTIIRPYITYGTTRIPFALISKRQQWTLIDRILNDRPIVIWDDGKAICTLTHTEDFAKGIIGLFGNPKALRQGFHITSDEHISWKEALEKIGQAVNKKVKIVYIPSQTIENEISEMRGELTEDKAITRRFNNAKIKSAVENFECKTMFADGIKETICHYQKHPELMSIDSGWNARIDILIYKYYKNNYPDDLNTKESFGMSKSNVKNLIYYLKCVSIVMFHMIINKIKWFVRGMVAQIKKIINYEYIKK